MARYFGKLTVYRYDPKRADADVFGMVARSADPDMLITGQPAPARYAGGSSMLQTSTVKVHADGTHTTRMRPHERSCRSLAWQLEQYELSMLGPVPRGMESAAAAYAAHAVALRVAS